MLWHCHVTKIQDPSIKVLNLHVSFSSVSVVMTYTLYVQSISTLRIIGSVRSIVLVHIEANCMSHDLQYIYNTFLFPLFNFLLHHACKHKVLMLSIVFCISSYSTFYYTTYKINLCPFLHLSYLRQVYRSLFVLYIYKTIRKCRLCDWT